MYCTMKLHSLRLAITGYCLLEAVQGKHCRDEAGKFPASPAQGESVKLISHQSHQ